MKVSNLKTGETQRQCGGPLDFHFVTLLVVTHFVKQAKQREPSQTKSFLQQLVITDLRAQHFLPSLLCIFIIHQSSFINHPSSTNYSSSIMSFVLASTMLYHRERRPFLNVAQNEAQAISGLNDARRRLREANAVVPRSERAVRNAENVVLDQIRVLTATHYHMVSVPTQQPPTIDQGQTTDLAAMSRVMSHVAPVGPRSNTVHDPYIPKRNHGAYFCPWHNKYVNHDAASCLDGIFFETNGVSLAQYQGLGLRPPSRQRLQGHLHRLQADEQMRDPHPSGTPTSSSDAGEPSGGQSSNSRGHQAQLPPRYHGANGQQSDHHDSRPQAPISCQRECSRSRRHQGYRNCSPRRQHERSRSPRRHQEHHGYPPRVQDEHNSLHRRQEYRDRSPLRQRARSRSIHRQEVLVRMPHRQHEYSRSPRRRQDERSRSPRRQRERRGMAHRLDMHNRSSRHQNERSRSPRHQEYRDRSPLGQRECSRSTHRQEDRVRLLRYQHERSRSPRRHQERSHSPRGQEEPDHLHRRQGYRDRSPVRQRERSSSAYRPVERIRLVRRRDDRSRSPHH